jgi:hypothetical protein
MCPSLLHRLSATDDGVSDLLAELDTPIKLLLALR